MVTDEALTRIANTLERRLERKYDIDAATTTLTHDAASPRIEYRLATRLPATALMHIETQTFLYNRTEYRASVGLYHPVRGILNITISPTRLTFTAQEATQTVSDKTDTAEQVKETEL